MAIHIGNEQTTAQNTAQSVNPQFQQPKPQSQGQRDIKPLGAPIFGVTNKLYAFGSGGEYFEKLFDKISEKIKMLNEDSKEDTEKYSAVKLLKSTAGLNYSGIVIGEKMGNKASAHILIVERTGDYPEKLIENVAGVRYEILRTPADALDTKYVRQAQIAAASALKVDVDSVEVVDGTLVPNEFDVSNENAITEILKNCLDAVHSENLIAQTSYTGTNVQDIFNEYRNGRFVINLYFNGDGDDHIDQTQMPIRQDVCVSLSFKANTNTSNRSVNQGEDTFELTRVYGYIDFEYTGPSIYNNVISTQKYVPNFVITHIEAKVAPTPDIVMLGVVSCLAINEDMNWLQAFRPSAGRKGEVDYNDIGALNIEGNIENNPNGFGKKYDTKSKTFTIMELGKFVSTLVRPNLIVSIDVPKAGPETWFTSVLQYIKFHNSQKAAERLFTHLRTLTNGSFAPSGLPVFADVANKVHGGFYRTKEGVRDIRHLSSYLSVANFVADTNQRPDLISQYTNTMYNTSIPQELRASERKKYIDNMSNNTAVYKQFYDRLTFNANFLLQLLGALKSVGFAPMFSNMGVGNDMFVKRSTVDFGAAMLGNDARVIGQNNPYVNFLMSGVYGRNF
jgi:hypothetical protein